jgi:hypothetical protein
MEDSSSNKSSASSDDGAPNVTLTCYGDDAVNNYRAFFYYDRAKDSDHRTLYLENDGGEPGYTKLPVRFTEKTDKSYTFSCSERLECDEVVIHRDTLELHRLVSTGLTSNPSGPDTSTANYSYKCQITNPNNAEGTLALMNNAIQQKGTENQQEQQRQKQEQLQKDRF